MAAGAFQADRRCPLGRGRLPEPFLALRWWRRGFAVEDEAGGSEEVGREGVRHVDRLPQVLFVMSPGGPLPRATGDCSPPAPESCRRTPTKLRTALSP